MRGYGYIRVFRTASKDEDVEHWATNDLTIRVQQWESLGNRGLPSRHQTVLRHGKIPDAQSGSPAKSHPHGPPSFLAAGSAPPENRRQLVPVQSGHQSLPHHRRREPPARGIEPPVFGNARPCVDVPLFVGPSARCSLPQSPPPDWGLSLSRQTIQYPRGRFPAAPKTANRSGATLTVLSFIR